MLFNLKFDPYIALCVVCLVCLIFYSIYRKLSGKKGSWTKNTGINIQTLTFKQPSIGKESKGERECRITMEKLFNVPFKKVRPYWLRNEVSGGDNNLELDCFNEDLRLAVEYNGRQHYEFIKFFHKNKEAFLNQKYRDDMKRRLCKERGICLIEVPYTIKIPDIENYIRKQIRYKYKSQKYFNK